MGQFADAKTEVDPHCQAASVPLPEVLSAEEVDASDFNGWPPPGKVSTRPVCGRKPLGFQEKNKKKNRKLGFTFWGALLALTHLKANQPSTTPRKLEGHANHRVGFHWEIGRDLGEW